LQVRNFQEGVLVKGEIIGKEGVTGAFSCGGETKKFQIPESGIFKIKIR
jgi:hypothetical protein